MWSHYTANHCTVVERRRDGKFIVTIGSRHDNESTTVTVYDDVEVALRNAGYPIDFADLIGWPRIPVGLQ